MKEKFIEKIADAGRAIWEIKLFDILMDTIICFMAFSILLALMGKSLLYGLIPTSVYLIAALIRSVMKSDVIGTIENKNENLDESLKTAYDNKDHENIIVTELLSDVSNKIDNVETSTFVDSKKVSYKVAVSIGLMLLMLFITFVNLNGVFTNLFDLDYLRGGLNDFMKERGIEYERLAGDERWENSNLTTDKENEKLGSEPGGEKPGFNMGPIPGGGGGVGSDDNKEIYGKPSSAAIEGSNLDFSLRPDYGGEIEIKEESKGEGKSTITTAKGVESPETCDECAIGPEYEELVKRYFEKIVNEV